MTTWPSRSKKRLTLPLKKCRDDQKGRRSPGTSRPNLSMEVTAATLYSQGKNCAVVSMLVPPLNLCPNTSSRNVACGNPSR